MSLRAGRRLLVTAALGAMVLSACTGSDDDRAPGPEPLPATQTAATAAASTSGPTRTANGSVSASAASGGTGSSAPLTRTEWRSRLLAVSNGFNEARAVCFADPVACVPVFDATLGTHLSGVALTDVRANLRNEAARRIRTRGIDPGTMYVSAFQVHTTDPVDSAISFCVVDTAVRYVAATGTRREKIVDGSKVTYFVVYRIQAGTDAELRISKIDSTPFVRLTGKHGQCDRYVN